MTSLHSPESIKLVIQEPGAIGDGCHQQQPRQPFKGQGMEQLLCDLDKANGYALQPRVYPVRWCLTSTLESRPGLTLEEGHTGAPVWD